jgi:rRNA processing protein Gar1
MSGHVRGLGKVSTIAYNGNLIIRADFAPRVSSKVLNAKNEVLGHVARIFGPIDKPYVSVKPSKKPGLNMMNEEVYIASK